MIKYLINIFVLILIDMKSDLLFNKTVLPVELLEPQLINISFQKKINKYYK